MSASTCRNPRTDGGNGVLIEVLNGEGVPVADLIVGKEANAEDIDGQSLLYVRSPDEDQVWLAKGLGLTGLSADPVDWLDTELFTLPKERVATIALTPFEGAPFSLSRPTADIPDFVIDNLPADLQLKSATGRQCL